MGKKIVNAVIQAPGGKKKKGATPNPNSLNQLQKLKQENDLLRAKVHPSS